MKLKLHQQKLYQRRRGFTLLQIVIVVAIIGILSAVSMSVYSRSRSAAYRAQCDIHLKSIALALDAFKQEQGHYPNNLQELLDDKYISDASLMRCPADPRQNASYEDFYAIRTPRDANELPILVCPFHENTNGIQAYVGKYTTQFLASPAILTAAVGVTVEHPGKQPVSAPVGLQLRGADILHTGGGGSGTVTFSDGSTADLGQNTDVTLMQSFVDGNSQSPLYTLVHQTLGAAIYTIHHGSKFDVVTPTATAGALGTRFEIRISPYDQTTWLQVTDGTVKLNTLAIGAAMVNDEHWNSTVPPGNAPPGGHRPPPPRPGRNPYPPPPR